MFVPEIICNSLIHTSITTSVFFTGVPKRGVVLYDCVLRRRVFEISMNMTADLNTILDAEEEPVQQGHDQTAEEDIHAQHMFRLQAEAEARDLSQKLKVYRQQFAEYAKEKAMIDQELAVKLGSFADSVLCLCASPERQKLLEMASALKSDLLNSVTEGMNRSQLISEETDRATKRSAGEAFVNTHGDPLMEQSDPSEDNSDLMGEDQPSLDESEFSYDSISERAKYIPLRLSHEERRLLRLLEGALTVSEYTDKVDILSYRSKHARVHAQIKDLCAILCGLTVAQNYKRGSQLILDRDFADLQDFFQTCFEIGRRHKVMNPDKMRDTYGKLMYMLMDSVEPEIQELLGFECSKPLLTVWSFLEAGGASRLLDDPNLPIAIAEIKSSGRTRYEIQKDIKTKEKVRDSLAKKYQTKDINSDDLLRCMYSLGDNNAYLRFNRDPIDRMIEYLETNFNPERIEEGLSLAIFGGKQGARLTHNHARQFCYVKQTLTLWREISHEMFKLWYMADKDMLSERNRYRLQNTGQGLQRVQSASSVGRAMSQIIARCQNKIGSWVGSSVVHLGDHNVPNALMFIDKYTQVPRILNPLVLALDELPKIAERDAAIKAYVDSIYGDVQMCKKQILADFFRHAFDGSGADNSFDAGSCIDGRLTSAWNWCSKIENKKYYSIFKLAGFTGFDGDFR